MKLFKHIFLFLLMAMSLYTRAQVNSKKESISTDKLRNSYDFFEKSISKNANESKVDVRPKLAKAKKWRTKNPSKALGFVQEALIASKAQGDDKSQAACYELLGKINFDQEKYDFAEVNFQKSTALFLSLGDELSYHNNLSLLAKAALKNGSLAKAKKTSETLLSSSSNEFLLSDAHEILGEVAYKSKDYETAITHFKKQEAYEQKLFEPKHSNYRLSRAQANIAKVYAVQNNIEGANEKMMESVSNMALDSVIVQKVSEEELAVSDEVDEYYEVQEEVYLNFRSNLPEQEILLRNKVLEQKESPVLNTILQKQSLGEAYLDSKEYDKAIDNLSESANYKWDAANIEFKAKSLKLLSEALNKSGRNEEALQKYEAYVEAQEQVLLQSSQKAMESSKLDAQQNTIALIEKEFDLYKSELDLLKEEEQSAAQKYRTQKMINYGLLFVLGLVAIGGYFIYKNSKEKRKANQMLALKSLRSQMNPHFIFNALNSVNSFISKNDERSANKFLTDFSKLMRMVLDSSHEDLIPLTQELSVIELYLKLEQYRFRDKFDYELVVSEEIDQDSFMIPPMLIQPFIENAVWHGLRYKKEFGKLKVVINELSEQIEVVIEDDGIGRGKSHELKTKNQSQTTSRGLQNTKERIKVINDLYETKLHLEVHDLLVGEQECGTSIKLVIPKISK